MKKALIFCIATLFGQQARASESAHSWYNPLGYLSSAGSWAREHKAITTLGLASAYALYRYSWHLQRQKKADKLIDTITTDFLPTAQANPPFAQQYENFSDEVKRFVSNLPWLEVGNRDIIFTPHLYGPFFDVTVMPLESIPAHIIAIVRGLKDYASPGKEQEFQAALLNQLEKQDQNNVTVNAWLNALNTQTRKYLPYPLPEYNTPYDNPINCTTVETCSEIINKMRNALSITDAPNVKKATK